MSNNLSSEFGAKRVADLKKRIANFVIETPSWGYRRGGSRFGTYETRSDAKTQEKKFALAGEFFRRTGKSQTVALHFPWDGVDAGEVKKLKKSSTKTTFKPEQSMQTISPSAPTVRSMPAFVLAA